MRGSAKPTNAERYRRSRRSGKHSGQHRDSRPFHSVPVAEQTTGIHLLNGTTQVRLRLRPLPTDKLSNVAGPALDCLANRFWRLVWLQPESSAHLAARHIPVRWVEMELTRSQFEKPCVARKSKRNINHRRALGEAFKATLPLLGDFPVTYDLHCFSKF